MLDFPTLVFPTPSSAAESRPRSQRSTRAFARPTRVASTFALLLIAAAGCRQHQSLDLPDRAAHTLPNRQEVSGLVVAAEAFLTPERVARYFGDTVWKAGYFPIVVRLENPDGARLEIERGQFSLVLSAGDEGTENGAQSQSPASLSEILRRSRSSTAAAWLLAPVLIFPAVWAASHVREFNHALTQDLATKILPTYYRLEATDRRLHGALFFRRPKGPKPLAEALENAELRLVARFEGSRVDPSSNEPATSQVGETANFVLPIVGTDE
ncbi:MAG: hypothetical protein AAF517_13575 [Planctomycetota bacterium]